MSLKLKPGDLVSIEPWDCEGVESPWGWDHYKLPEIRTSNAKHMSRARKLKIIPGTTGFVVGFDHHGVDDFDTHYVVIVNGKNLGVPVRFLHRVET